MTATEQQSTEQPTVKTACQLDREARELAIYNEYNALMAQPGARATAVEQLLMAKYAIYAKTTIWVIRKRVQQRLESKQ